MIRAYIGLLGQGKTISMVHDGLAALKKGRRVITNTPFVLRGFKKRLTLKEWWNGTIAVPHDVYPEFAETQKLLHLFKTVEDALFLIDEASIVFSNYSEKLLAGDYIARFAQSRKFGLDLYYTTQAFLHTNGRIRDLTNEVVQCVNHGVSIANFTYLPDAFLNNKMPPFMRKQFLLDQRFLTPWQLKNLYKAYDTLFTIESSATISVQNDTILHKESKFLKEQFGFLSEEPVQEISLSKPRKIYI